MSHEGSAIHSNRFLVDRPNFKFFLQDVFFALKSVDSIALELYTEQFL